MNLENFMKEALKNEPAKIEASVDEQGRSTIKFEGRLIELLPLSISIAEEIINKSPMYTVDDYCKLLQQIAANKKRKDISKEQRDVENEIMKKIFESVFK